MSYANISDEAVGAYEPKPSVYWIPGRRGVKPTFPVPAHGATVGMHRLGIFGWDMGKGKEVG